MTRAGESVAPPGGNPGLIIFDFDGVIVDSESLANEILADHLTGLGYRTSFDEAYEHYLGRSWKDCMGIFEARWGVPAPDGWRGEVKARIARRLGELRPVPGASEFIAGTAGMARCIASSSPPEWIEGRLRDFGLAEHFTDAIFSAAVHVARGKPHPDIYLHAASAMGVAPGEALVIEDSVTGVTAAVAAGTRVVGLCAASHVRADHGDRLRAAGAHAICHSFAEVRGLLGRAVR
jgi:HAD superfamily hydrolase (TIGR01509 family)